MIGKDIMNILFHTDIELVWKTFESLDDDSLWEIVNSLDYDEHPRAMAISAMADAELKRREENKRDKQIEIKFFGLD